MQVKCVRNASCSYLQIHTPRRDCSTLQSLYQSSSSPLHWVSPLFHPSIDNSLDLASSLQWSRDQLWDTNPVCSLCHLLVSVNPVRAYHWITYSNTTFLPSRCVAFKSSATSKAENSKSTNALFHCLWMQTNTVSNHFRKLPFSKRKPCTWIQFLHGLFQEATDANSLASQQSCIVMR